MNQRIRKKAIILDLDNTLYSVPSVGDEMFAGILNLIKESGQHDEQMDAIRDDIMRIPFQVIASRYKFSEELKQKGIDLLKELTYEGPIETFSDYEEVKALPIDKFLVTTGFLNLQQSKIDKMGIEQDFKEVTVVDPSTTDKTKKDVFADIMKRNGYDQSEVLVIGDDPDSEIKAGQDLGIDTVLFDKSNRYPDYGARRIADFKELEAFL